MISKNKISQEARQLVKDTLPGSEFVYDNGHDLVWEGLKIVVKGRGISGRMGEQAFVFSHFTRKDCIYVLLALTPEYSYPAWVYTASELGDVTTLYCNITDAHRLETLPAIIREKAKAPGVIYEKPL